MKTLLIALNAKYSHTSLSVRSICSYVKSKGDFDISCRELTVNDEYFYILKSIVKESPDLIGFSTYIWNIELIKKLIPDVKNLLPDSVIFLGGPEVSYNESIFSEIKDIDFVIKGEGELPVYNYLCGKTHAQGIWYKGEKSDFAPNLDLEDIPFVYSREELYSNSNKAIYYETSRGCPFKCAFCISSLTKGVRTLPLDRVFNEIDIFIESGVKRVKLVDRTFNFDKERTKKILRYITEKSKNTCFHFEIGADLLDDELIDIINNAKRDVIQFEAGIQSTNGETLLLCDRATDMERLKKNLKALCNSKIRIHLDLIAGLPKEDFSTFKKSFNEVYALNPDVLQVGFLKLLHGSKLRKEKEKYGYKFKSTAPYEVLSNDFISFPELMELKKVEKAVDCYLNSEIFKTSLSYIYNKGVNPFDFYYSLGCNMGDLNLSLKDKFKILLRTAEKYFENSEELKEYLKYDYFIKQRGAIPEFLNNYKTKSFLNKCSQFINDEENIKEIFPYYTGTNKAEIRKNLDFELFIYNGKEKIMCFDRINNILIDLSEKMSYYINEGN